MVIAGPRRRHPGFLGDACLIDPRSWFILHCPRASGGGRGGRQEFARSRRRKGWSNIAPHRRRGRAMKAAVLFKTNEPLEIVDVTLDPPKAGEVRVKMKATGVCQSDWHIMNGDWPMPLPMVPGHEASGIVAELGPGV